ncbi:MAG: cytochrome P450 [Acidimicrobiales bacterium]
MARLPGPRNPVELVRLAVLAERDLGRFLLDTYRRYGSVVEIGIGPLRFVYLFGQEANELILSTGTDHFEWGPALRRGLELVDGPSAIVLSDGAVHRRRRRLVQPAFSKKRVDDHLSLIVEELDSTVDGWTPGRHLDAHVELRAAIRRIVVRSLFGDRLGGRADEIGDALEPALQYIQRPFSRRIDIDLRVNGYARARRAVRAADALIDEEIAHRRRHGTGDGDTLSLLMAAADDEGGPALSDDELRDQVRSLIAAGYDTTSAGAAWVVHALGTHTAIRNQVRAEVRDRLGDQPPRIDELRHLPLVDGVVHEVLRLWPPGLLSGRKVVEPFDLHGHTIPAGRFVIYSAHVTHRLPELWPDPDAFRPERWAPDAPEPPPYAFVPFGGGYRRCIGFALATLELQALVCRLVQRVEWEPAYKHARPHGVAASTPRGGLPISVTAGI